VKHVVLHDLDSRIPNLALMKLGAFYRGQGCDVTLARPRFSTRPGAMPEADAHFASVIFHTPLSHRRLASLQAALGPRVEIGGSGFSLDRRLPPEAESCSPDYGLYRHTLYALGFLTRGCNKRCAFCIVPAKEGRLKRQTNSFDDFVPPGQRNVMLLDDNLLAYPEVEGLLLEMIDRGYAVNFSQTLDIAYLTESKYQLLRRIDYRSARFNNRMIYFSLNYPRTIRQFTDRREMLRGFGEDCVTVVCIYGFDTSLREDYERFYWLRRLRLIPFFQEYWPIAGVPSRLPREYFDVDLRDMLRLTFRSNGYNWEKYLRWLNRMYFARFGRFYRPLLNTIFRYNNKARFEWYLHRPELLTDELYRDFRGDARHGDAEWMASWKMKVGSRRNTPRSLRGILGSVGGSVGAPGAPLSEVTAPDEHTAALAARMQTHDSHGH
jgi:hypothetical protein